MKNQSGFSLFELMIAIAVIAILTAIAIPTYQSYVQKAATTEMLHVMTPVKTSVELCALEQNALTQCATGKHGVQNVQQTRYVDSVTVSAGKISIQGLSTLSDLRVELTPTLDTTNGSITWTQNCNTTSDSLKAACQSVFRFNEPAS